jgi:hypothetical protein
MPGLFQGIHWSQFLSGILDLGTIIGELFQNMY